MAHSAERTGYSLSADLFKDDTPTLLDQQITALVNQFSDDAIFGEIEDRLNFAVNVASLREEIKRTCSNQLEATHLIRTLHAGVAEKISLATERVIAEQRVSETALESLRALPVPVSALLPHIHHFYDKAVQAQSAVAASASPEDKVARLHHAEDVTMVAVSLGRDIPAEKKGTHTVERSGADVHAEWVIQAKKDAKQSNSRDKLESVRGVLMTAYGHDLRHQPLAKDIGKVAAAVAITGLMTAAPINAAHASVRVEKQGNQPSPQTHEEITDLSKPIKLTTNTTKPTEAEVTAESKATSTPAEAASAPIPVSLPEKAPAKTAPQEEKSPQKNATPVDMEVPATEDGPIRISLPDVTAALPKKKAPATDAVRASQPNATPAAAEAAPAEDQGQNMVTTLFPEGPLRISRGDIHIEHTQDTETNGGMQISLPPTAELPPTPVVAPAPAPAPVAAPEAPAPKAEVMTDRQQYVLAAQKLIDRGGEWKNRGILMKIFIENSEMQPVHAAAFVGNFMVEAPGLDPATHQGWGGPGRGLAQWGDNTNPANDRFGYDGTRGLVQFAKERGTSWDNIETQAYYVLHELETTEKGAYAKILATTTREDATMAVSTFYERPGEPHNPRRIESANIVAGGYNEELKAIRGVTKTPVAPSLEITTVDQRKDDGKVGDIPYAYQLDPRWANMPLPDGSGPIGPVACNPTSLSMVAMAIGDKTATPDKVYARYIADKRIGKDGAHQQSLLDLAPAFGLRANLIPNNDIEVFKKVIKDGGKIILSGNTNGRLLPNPGHFVVIYGISDSGNMLVADPGFPENNGKEFSLQAQVDASNSIRARLGTTNAGLHYNAVALYAK